MKSLKFVGLAFMILVFFSGFSQAAVPTTMSYQGKLSDSGGNPVTGTVSIKFTIYNASTGGTALWTETQSSVSVNNGLFTVILGSVTPQSSSVFSGSTRYLGVKVGTDAEMTPRQKLNSASFAFKADVADSLSSTGSGSGLDADKLDGSDSTAFQKRVSSSCPTGQSIRVISSTGTVTCEIDIDTNTTYSDGTGLNLSGTTFNIDVPLQLSGSSGSPIIYGSNSGTAEGVAGYNSSSGVGVRGASSSGYGVYGYSSSGTAGIYGRHSSGGKGYIGYSSTGVYGYSSSGYCVYGKNDSSGNYGYLGSSDYGVYGYSSSSTGYGVYGKNSSGMAGYFEGEVYVAGRLDATNKLFIQPHAENPAKEIAYVVVESPEAMVFQRGTAKLINGSAVIDLPDHFSVVAAIEGIEVQVTPYSADTQGLAVVERTRERIVVKELAGGNGNFEFGYFVTAIRRGFEGHEPVVANKHFKPMPGETVAEFEERYSKDDMASKAIRGMLISNGILNVDGTLNMATIEKLGWTFADESSSPDDSVNELSMR